MKQRPSFPASFSTFNSSSKSLIQKKPLTILSKPSTLDLKRLAISSSSVGHGLDSSAVRMNMIRQIQADGVDNPIVITAMTKIERHRFVDSALINQAYEDTSLPIGWGQTISKPGVVARMLGLLCRGSIEKLGRVLEIGTGCGYQAALLSLVAREVYSIERLSGLHERARVNLRPFRLPNLHMMLGDGMLGYAKGAPYAAIISAAGGETVPKAWTDQLAIGGRLVAPMYGTGPSKGQQSLLVVDKTERGLVETRFEAVSFVPLKSGVA